jgi:hypothetical protein
MQYDVVAPPPSHVNESLAAAGMPASSGVHIPHS